MSIAVGIAWFALLVIMEAPIEIAFLVSAIITVFLTVIDKDRR